MLIPYYRQSRKRERTISIDEQRRDVHAWAERNGVELGDEIIDQGVSGSKGWRDRALGAAISACERGEATGVIVAYESRLSRESGLGTAEVWEALQQAKARLVCVAENLDSDAEGSEFMFAIHAAVARQEWRKSKDNFDRGKHAAWEAGIYVGPAPAGYESTKTIDASGKRTPGPLRKTDHAEAVGRAITLRAGGGSWTEVSRLLTAAGVPTSRGKTTWTKQSARSVVSNMIYMGVHQCTCCNRTALRSEWAVVTRATWFKAQPSEESPKKGRQDVGESLLGGLLICSSCGKTMGYQGSGQYRYYRCRTDSVECSQRVAISAPQAEAYLKAEALELFMGTGPRIGYEPDVEREVELEAARDAARDELEALVMMLRPTDPGAGARLEAARGALDAAETALLAEHQASVELLSEEVVRASFESAPIPDQRLLLRRMLHFAKVYPGRDAVEERIEIEPRNVILAAS